MSRIEEIKSRLENLIITEFDKGVEHIDAEEMYKACDMLKDVTNAYYWCALVKAMEENEDSYGDKWDEDGLKYYTQPKRMTPSRYHKIDTMTNGRMYYTEPNSEYEGHDEMRDGRSWEKRRKYYETKPASDLNVKMQALEDYAKTLTDDVMEMIRDASDSEKQMLRTKMQVLAQKIQ